MDGIGKKFMEMTKYQFLGKSSQARGLPQPPLEKEFDTSKPPINLPQPDKLKLGNVPLIEVINNRRSIRKYSDTPLSLEELSYLLWCTQGVKKVADKVTFRTVPSAGARHAFETYVLINKVEGVIPGLYRYLALRHKLLELNTEQDIADKIVAGCMRHTFVASSAATFIWVADVARMAWRYGERGYRYLHLDAGHVCQNLYLAAESIGCGACAIAAFDDDFINEVIGIDGVDEFVIYVATVGKKI